MTPDRWQQVKDIFHAVLAQPPQRRADFLTQTCAGDAELCAEVESLLAAYVTPVQTEPIIRSETEIMVSLGAAKTPQPRRDAAVTSGQTLGDYRIIRLLGRGGMAEVHLAEDTRLGRQVALKLLPAASAAHGDRVQRFRQEARAVSALNHPNIVTVFEVGRIGDHYFISTEFVAGETLRTVIKGRDKSSPTALRQALDAAVQAAGALAAAHEAGIVHRDIKPENLMLRPDGYLKVLDFGLAKLLEKSGGLGEWGSGSLGEWGNEQAGEFSLSPVPPLPRSPAPPLTNPGTVMGTVAYMSPEQARGLEVDARSDIFSLGVVLYELSTGVRPFLGVSSSDIIAAILTREPAPLARHLPAAPRELEWVCTRALAKDRADRYQTMRELLGDLKRVQRRLELAAARPPNDASMPSTGLEEPRGPASLPLLGLSSQPSADAEADAARRRKRIDSLAVLPFANTGGDEQMEYLSDGITESIINNLAPLTGLRVMARATVFRYRGREVDPQTVGRELNVRAVVVGQVRRLGERLVIRAELVDAADGSLLWSERYNRTLADIFAVEEEIAREISAQLRLKLTVEQDQRLAKRPTANAEAYQLYLKGRYFWNKRTEETMAKSITFFEQAIALDPDYALAHVGLADAYTVLGANGIWPLAETMPKAKAAVLRALQLDEQLGEAHATLALVTAIHDWDWPTAEREFQRAIELKPGYPTAHFWYTVGFLTTRKRFAEAHREMERALELDPLSIPLNTNYGWLLLVTGQSDRAIEQLQRALEIDAGHAGALEYLATAYEQASRYDEALDARCRRMELLGAGTAEMAAMRAAFAAAGAEGYWRCELDWLRDQAQRRYVVPLNFAELHARLHEREQALLWLRRAYDERAGQVIWLNVNPIFESLRTDAEFIALLRQIGLTP